MILGLMASGKTTVGRALATRLARRFVDNDDRLEARTGLTAREIAASEGVDGLHLREAEALVDALSSPEPTVVAAAASVASNPAAIAAMRPHDVIYLSAPPAVLAARLERAPASDDHRPLVTTDPRGVLDAQFAARDDRYRALATVVVDAGGDDPDAIVTEIVTALRRAAT